MKNNQQNMVKEHKEFFKLDKTLNGNLPVFAATACEKKCIKCNVSSKDCSHS